MAQRARRSEKPIRGLGLGSDLVEAFASWVKEKGGRGLLLGVQAQNSGAKRFWKKLGFDEIERRASVRQGIKDNELLILRRSL